MAPLRTWRGSFLGVSVAPYHQPSSFQTGMPRPNPEGIEHEEQGGVCGCWQRGRWPLAEGVAAAGRGGGGHWQRGLRLLAEGEVAAGRTRGAGRRWGQGKAGRV